MRDVAATARVSIKSVSRVINGESLVSDALKLRVLTAVNQLHYECNINASRLRRADGRSQTIALIMEDVASSFSSSLLSAIQDVALDRGVLVFTGVLGRDADLEHKLMNALTFHRVDGLVISASPADDYQMGLGRQLRMPVILIDTTQRVAEFDSVLTDDVAGARAGVRHLLAHGHIRIGYVGGPASNGAASRRYQGYVQELSAGSVCIDEQQVRHDIGDADAARVATVTLLSRPHRPTAVFTGDSVTTLGAKRAIRSLGLHHEVAHVGFDNCLLTELIEGGVSVVARDPVAAGRRAAALLFRRIDGDRSPYTGEVVPPHLICRGSGEIVLRRVH